MKSLKKLIADHARLLENYRYAYISSTALFLLLPGYKGTPRDFDIALDWQGKSKKQLLILYKYLKTQVWVKNIRFETIESQTTTKYSVQKNQHICLNFPAFNELLIQWNIKLTYIYKTMPVELFPEQEGNGVTNIDTCNPKIIYIKINNIKVPVLDILEVAKRYIINFIDEVTHKQFTNIKHPDYKHKDALRLNTIIQILYVSQRDASPRWLLSFINQYIKELKKQLPSVNRSIFIQKILVNYPKVYKKLSYITKLYIKLSRQQLDGTDDVDFSTFHAELKQELTKIYEIIHLYQNHILHNLYIKKSNFLKRVQQIECEKIQEYIQKINLTNKINGFAYFYEVYSIIYMIKNHE